MLLYQTSDFWAFCLDMLLGETKKALDLIPDIVNYPSHSKTWLDLALELET